MKYQKPLLQTLGNTISYGWLDCTSGSTATQICQSGSVLDHCTTGGGVLTVGCSPGSITAAGSWCNAGTSGGDSSNLCTSGASRAFNPEGCTAGGSPACITGSAT